MLVLLCTFGDVRLVFRCISMFRVLRNEGLGWGYPGVKERCCIGAKEARRGCVWCRSDFLCRDWEWTACCAGGRWGGWLGRAVQGRRRGVAGGGFVCAAVSLDQTTEA